MFGGENVNKNESKDGAVITLIIIALLILAANMITGCVTFEHELTGPEGYTFRESGTAWGGGSIEKLNQGVGATMKLYNKDGSLRAEVTLESSQEAEGMTSDMEAILAGISFFKMMGTMMVPVP